MNKIWFDRINNRDNIKFEVDETGKFEMSQGKNYVSIRLNSSEINNLMNFLKGRKTNNY